MPAEHRDNEGSTPADRQAVLAMPAIVLVDRASELGARIALAVAVTCGFVLVGRLLAPVVRRVLDRRRRPSYTRVFVGLFRVAIALVGVLASLTLAFPSVRVADVLAIFGIVSVAAGFAFKDTFENLLAGVLLMLHDPFKSGDEVTVAGATGTVEGVTVRETLLRGHDGRRYFVPNSKVMTDVIDVGTDRAAVRQVFSLSLDRNCDLQLIRAAISEALVGAVGVLSHPPPDAVVTDLVDGDPVLTCRFWARSSRAASTAARDAAITAVLARLVSDNVPSSNPEHRVIITNDARAGVQDPRHRSFEHNRSNEQD